MKIDFGTSDCQDGWNVVDDRVMGGRSLGQITCKDQSLKFHGKLSLANNGGFSWAQYDMNLSKDKTSNIKLGVRTDEHSYSLTARSSSDRGYHFESEPFSTNGEWEEITVKTTDMVKTWRGRNFDDKLEQSDEIVQLGLILKDKKEGSFEIDLEWFVLD